MPISSNNVGLRPGVCTSTTRPTTPYTGQVIYETDTGYLRVWDGSAWDYLSQKQDDTVGLGPVGGLVYITSVSIGSAVSSAVVSNCFSSTYVNYRVVYVIDSMSATTSLRLQFGSTSDGHYTSGQFFPLGTSTAGAFNTSNLSTIAVSQGYTGTSLQGSFDVLSPYLSTRTMVMGQGVGGNDYVHFGGTQNANNSYTGFTFSPASGTFTGGTIRIYGYRNS